MNWQIIFGTLFLIGGIENLLKDFSNALFALLIGAALLYWGLKRKGFIKKRVAQPQIEARTLKEETFAAVGVSYYENNIRKLACNNPDWALTAAQIMNSGKAGKRIFKYYYVSNPVKLRPEPENPHDKNAIAVIIAGELVGYIGRGDNLHVKDLLQKHEIKSLSGFIGGGEYKVVTEDGEVIKDENGFSVTVRIKYI